MCTEGALIGIVFRIVGGDVTRRCQLTAWDGIRLNHTVTITMVSPPLWTMHIGSIALANRLHIRLFISFYWLCHRVGRVWLVRLFNRLIHKDKRGELIG